MKLGHTNQIEEKLERCFCCGIFATREKLNNLEGAALHRGSNSASHPVAPGLILGIPKSFLRILDVAEI